MKNRVTLSDLIGMTDEQKRAIPPDQLIELYDDLAEDRAELESRSEALHGAMSMRYADTFDGERTKSTGVVHIQDGRYRITQDIKKSVRYDQKKLRTILRTLEQEGRDINEYVEVFYRVPEKNWNYWTSEARERFEPARVVHSPRPSYSIEVVA